MVNLFTGVAYNCGELGVTYIYMDIIDYRCHYESFIKGRWDYLCYYCSVIFIHFITGFPAHSLHVSMGMVGTHMSN